MRIPQAKKLLLCFHQYGPYHLARLRQAIQEFGLESIQVKGLEFSSVQGEYDWVRPDISDLPLYQLSSTSLEDTRTWLWPILVRQAMKPLSPDAVFLAGYSHPAALTILAWAKWHRKKIFLMSDTKLDDSERRPVREMIKSAIVRLFDGAIVAGAASRNYLITLGLDASTIHTPYDVVDNSAYARPDQIGAPLMTTKRYFICTSRFLPRKNIPALIRAYAQYQGECLRFNLEPYDLRLCGSGPEEHEIQCQIEEAKLQKAVHLHGFVQEGELKGLLYQAEAVIQPSLVDMWVLAINEAMAAEVPCLVSHQCGCVPELAENGVTAWTFDPTSESDMATTLLTFHLSSENERRTKVKAAKKRVNERYGLSNFVLAMKKCLAIT